MKASTYLVNSIFLAKRETGPAHAGPVAEGCAGSRVMRL
jgi:hypothetical protein